MARKPKAPKRIETLTHEEATRKNIPTAELQSVAQRVEEVNPFEPVTYPRQNPLAEGEARPRDEDLDPQIIWKGATLRLSPEQIEELTKTGKLEIGEAQLTWRGKDTQDWSDLVVQAPPLYIQEKIHPKALIEDLKRQTERRAKDHTDAPDMFDMFDMFGDFNGIDPEAKTEFYAHDQNWQNRMILGDSLQVMASLAEREGLRGKVQCIYFDPPYGIKFNSNWQVSTRSRDVKDGKLDQITREPEQVKAFRDTWADGIHSYLTYLRDRMTVMRDLLTESGSIFVQIGDENVHRVRALMDEIFGEDNFCSLIQIQKTGSQAAALLANTVDFIAWYSKDKSKVKYRKLYNIRTPGHVSSDRYDQIELEAGSERRLTRDEIERMSPLPAGKIFRHTSLLSAGSSSADQSFSFNGKEYKPSSGNHWKTPPERLLNLAKASRIYQSTGGLQYKRYLDDFSVIPINDRWESMQLGTGLIYVVQTSPQSVARCILMTSDPGDLVLDPTCGSGTTATVAEQWGRRWITLDTSRVSLALARTRLMGSRYPYYYLSDSPEGHAKEQDVSGKVQPDAPTHRDIRQGFVYECQ